MTYNEMTKKIIEKGRGISGTYYLEKTNARSDNE